MRSLKNSRRKRSIWAWCMYDWANSAFATSVLAGILPVYFSSLVPKEGVILGWGAWRWTASASGLWAYTISFSLLLVAVCAPVLGALADLSRTKKQFLFVFTYVGALFTCFLYFVQTGGWLLCLVFFLVANIGFAASMPFYNAFLPDLVSEEYKMDWISAKAYAFGYAGGGLLLAIHVLLISHYQVFGIPDTGTSMRISIASVGPWWGLFALPLFLWTPESQYVQRQPKEKISMLLGFSRFLKTLRSFHNYRDLAWFLVAFLVYNDGIQTVIAMATIFGKTALNLTPTTLVGTLLLTQFVALPGALFFGRLAQSMGAKGVVMVTLVFWIGIVSYAYFLRYAFEFWVLGAVVGFILGGSQAISRSLFGQLIPLDRSAEFFGFFAVSGKFASIFGPLVFGLVSDLATEPRKAILSLVVFFALGILLLSRVDVKRGRLQALKGS